MKNYEQFLKIITQDLDKIFDYQKEYLFCKKGCSLCCEKGDYPISQIEYNYMQEGFNNLEDDTKKIVKNNIENLKEIGEEPYKCPFLINKQCSIYEHRPIVCRTFGVLTEDASGNPTFPFCATMGLNFSQIYDKEKNCLSTPKAQSLNFKIFPKIFRLNNKVIMNIPLAKELNIEFGKTGKMIDFLFDEQKKMFKLIQCRPMLPCQTNRH